MKGGTQGAITPAASTGSTKRRAASDHPTTTAPALRRDLEASLQLALSDKMKRITVATHFIMDHDAAPTGRQKLWDGSGGVVLALARELFF